MTPDADDTKGDGTPRRRGTRGGRRRRTTGASADDGERSGSLQDPRVVGRRPSKPVEAAKVDDDSKASAKDETPAKAEPEKKEPAKSTRSRSRSRTSRSRATAKAKEPEATEDTKESATSEPKAEPTSKAAVASVAIDAGDAATLASHFQSLQTAIGDLAEKVEQGRRRLRLGVFVDVPNVIYGAERDEGPNGPSGAIDMGKLLDYLSEGRDLVRATAYAPVSDDPSEPVERQRFVAPFVPYAYRIVTKPLKRFADGSIKGNFDVELAVDMVTMAERLDVIAIVSGDADFARAVELVQGRGVRVEVVAFSGSTSVDMRAIADRYVELGAIAKQLRP